MGAFQGSPPNNILDSLCFLALQEGTNSIFGITDQLALNMLLEEARAGRSHARNSCICSLGHRLALLAPEDFAAGRAGAQASRVSLLPYVSSLRL